jgi:environmental stress-induced protein Ves
VRILRAADRSAVPWKNGGGVTRDVAVFPTGSSPDKFDWRVSIAEIASSGPFSVFAGIDRQFAVLGGQVVLTAEGEPMTLGPQSAVLSFPGEALVYAAPVGGISTDLNVMTRRATFESRTSRGSAGPMPLSAGVTIIIALGDLTAAGKPMTALDALQIDDPAHIRTINIDGEFYVIEINALPPQ